MKLDEILYQKTNDTLKQLAQLAGGCQGATRKDALVRCIQQTLMTPASLKQLWQRLDDLSKKAVAAAYHNDGEFNEVAFMAQYGALPERSQNKLLFWQAKPILLDLFIYDRVLPADLLPLLADLVPPPEPFQLEGVAEAPQTVVWQDRHKVKLIRADTEQAGWHDLLAYLRLVAQGQLNISSTTGNTTLAGIKKIVESLVKGDFLPLPEKYRAGDTIRPFGLDIFARQSGLVAYSSRSGLALTETGQQFYQTQDPEALLQAFETWTQEGQFDELTRIAALKGLGSKQTYLTEAAARREPVIEALSWCPVNVWIDIQSFYRALKIWHFDFEVETTYYTGLYVGYRDYGTLYGDAYWAIVKGLYINVVLWEYLGSIGALDLLYTKPEEADLETYADYLQYDEDWFSLYDGLKYFRINNLGAYLLGQAGEYISSKPLNPPLFTISPDKELVVTDPEHLTPNDLHQLELVALPAGNGHYRLDTRQVLSAVESGNDWEHLADFLAGRHNGPLPAEILAWLDKLKQNSRAFKTGQRALFIRVKEAELIEMVMADSVLQKFCHRIDHKTLVIPANKEQTFRSRLKELEYMLE